MRELVASSNSSSAWRKFKNNKTILQGPTEINNEKGKTMELKDFGRRPSSRTRQNGGALSLEGEQQ